MLLLLMLSVLLASSSWRFSSSWEVNREYLSKLYLRQTDKDLKSGNDQNVLSGLLLRFDRTEKTEQMEVRVR
jgi:hypothetical protein